MQDEHFMRQWSAGHSQFSAGIAMVFARIARGLRSRMRGQSPIENTYEEPHETPLARKARLVMIAVIGGVTAGSGIAAVLLALAAMAPPAHGQPVTAIRTTVLPLA
ncbi:hypothetical protein [Novosphingobium naphthalenivorans]|uniref:hypothetical protein n=1 Tax=Novosphingobium naphthalenivorans TaxID=273168 RepID=UPI0008333BC9|nr:hypothetical protein [Novosphingobium naphthalenivorans]